MSRFFPVLMFLAALVAAPAMAHADGAVLRTADLGASAPHLASLVAAARLRDPAAFDAVAQLNPHRPEQYKRWRSQNPGTAAFAFRRLGPTARFALVDLAVFHGPSQDGLEAREWQALQAGLVDAIGLAADPSSAPPTRRCRTWPRWASGASAPVSLAPSSATRAATMCASSPRCAGSA